MPLPVLPGVLRVTAHGACEGGGRWSNTWHAGHDDLGDWTEAEIQAFHDTFSQLYIGPQLGAGCSVIDEVSAGTTVDGFDYTPLDGTSGAFTHQVLGVSTNSQPTLPAQTAAVITIRTALRGRANRGRVYLPPFHNLVSDADGHILAAAINCLLVQLAAVTTALATGGVHLGVGSYGPYMDPALIAAWIAGGRTGPRPVPTIFTGAHFTPAINFSMDNLFDVQRKRKS